MENVPPENRETGGWGDPLLFVPAHDHHHRHDWLLPVMITVSLFFHGLMFYLVQASNPAVHSTAFPSARLSILNAQDPQDQPILAWINDHDPAGISRRREEINPPAELLGVAFQPGFKERQPQLQTITEKPLTVDFPSIASPSALLIGRRPANASAPAKTSALTQVRLLSPGSIIPASGVAFQPPTSSDIPLPSRFLIQIASDGHLREAFLQSSSGNDALDRYALTWLQAGQFQLTAPGENWTGAIFIWGSEIFPARPQ